MNIEESIEILKNIILMPDGWIIGKDYKGNLEFIGCIEGQEAIETLLTAYEKEKEKNKELSDKLTEKICKGVEEDILEEYRQVIIDKDKMIEELKKYKKKDKK